MTVQSCKLQNESHSLVDGQSRYTAKYEIIGDNRGQSCRSARGEAHTALPDPLPMYYSTYSLLGTTDPSAFCQSIEVKRKSDRDATRYIAQVQWFPIDGDPNNDQTSEDDPLLVEPVFWGEFRDVQIPVELARNIEALPGIGRNAGTLGPIQNAAGQEPSSPIMKTVRVPVLIAERNYTNLLSLLDIGYQLSDAINDDVFFGAAAGKAAFHGMTISRPKVGGGTVYWPVQLRVAMFEEGWRYKMVNRGFKFLFDDGGTTKLREATIEDSDGNDVPVAEPVNLELDGTQTPAGQIGTVINWETATEKDFSLLGIGTTWTA